MRQLLMLVRPFHIVHQLTIVMLVIGVHRLSPTFLQVIGAWLMLFLLMPFLFGLNDWMHRKEDAEMGRDRLFTSKNIHPNAVLLGLATILLTMNSIALTSGWTTLLWLYAMITCGMLYGYAKHRRMTATTYLFRTLSGMTFYLVTASHFGYHNEFALATFIGLLDLFSHIAGDLRDYPLDLVGKVQTFPVRFGIPRTLVLVAIVQGIAFVFLAGIIDLPRMFWMSVLLFSSLGWSAYLLFKFLEIHALQHACFHGVKIAVYVLIPATLWNAAWAVPLVMLGWAVSYLLYLWADNRLGELRPLMVINPLAL